MNNNKQTAKVLIADDNPAILGVIANKLKRREINIIQVKNGREALAEIKKNMPDLLLLDLIMPEIDGFEVLEKIQGKKIPVLVLSNLGQESDIQKAKSLGASNYVVKSNMSINNVIEKVMEMLADIKKAPPNRQLL